MTSLITVLEHQSREECIYRRHNIKQQKHRNFTQFVTTKIWVRSQVCVYIYIYILKK